MIKIFIFLAVFSMLVGCRYNTHLPRVGEPNDPYPLSSTDRAGNKAVSYGATPTSSVPELLQPITRTMWIKGHQRPNGDYVGDYPLTCVFQKGQLAHVTQPAAPVVPRAVKFDGPSGEAPRPTVIDPSRPTVLEGGTHGPAPTYSAPARLDPSVEAIREQYKQLLSPALPQ